jgi:hypothetical protein
MMRLILLVAFVAVVAIAVITMLGTLQAVAQAANGKDDTPMPERFRRVTYLLLILLMLGVTSGLLGAA